MKLAMHPKANVPVSIGECKSTLAVHLAVSPTTNVDIAIFPCEGALAIKISIPDVTNVRRLGVGPPMMPGHSVQVTLRVLARMEESHQ